MVLTTMDTKNFKVEDIPSWAVLQHPVFQELSQTLEKGLSLGENLKIPYIIKNRVLMSPGTWNTYLYSKDAITKAHNNTNWDNIDVVSLYYDHSDRSSKDWVGKVTNVTLDENGFVRGDLEIYDMNLAVKLAYGNPRFGVSPKVRGSAKNKVINDFVYENFSIVVNPAVKTTYLNQEVKNMDEENKVEKTEEKPVEKKEEEKQEQNTDTKEPEKQEDKKEEEKPTEEPKKEEPAEDKELAEYTKFVKEYKEKNQNATYEEIAKEWQMQKEYNELVNNKKLFEEFREFIKSKNNEQKPVEKKEMKEKVTDRTEKVENVMSELAQTNVDAGLIEFLNKEVLE